MVKIVAFDPWASAEPRAQWRSVSEGELVELGKSDTAEDLGKSDTAEDRL